MKIAITGTPGIGKTTVAKVLAKKLGYRYIDLNEIAKQHRFFLGYDEQRKAKVVDIERIKEYVASLNENIVIDSHYSHLMPVDIIFLLRADIDLLKKRMIRKGWKKRKINENLQVEIFEIIKEECWGKKFYEVYTDKGTNETVDEILWLLNVLEINLQRNIKLNEKIKKELRKPYGKVFDSNDYGENIRKVRIFTKDCRFIYAVGDRTSYEMISSGFIPNWIIYDGKERRKRFLRKISFDAPLIIMRNKRGYICQDLFGKIKENARRVENLRVFVKGEEDIAVLPLILFAHKNSAILYGLFDKLVCVKIDSEIRKRILKLLKFVMK